MSCLIVVPVNRDAPVDRDQGPVLLITPLVQLADSLRPAAQDGIRLRDMLVSTPAGTSLNLPPGLFRDAAIALVSVLVLHELVHSLFYWWFSTRRPKFGLKGLFPYAAAPAGVYYPRNRFLATNRPEGWLLEILDDLDKAFGTFSEQTVPKDGS